MAALAERVRDLRGRASERYLLLVAQASTGLPNWKVVVWFPALAALGVVVLVVLHWSGSSSGMYFYSFGEGQDPRLVLGSPRAIRSDEWLVQQSWVVSQSNTGWQPTNPTFPGGSDMTVLNELPSWHWSSVFRPHLWGYLLFGLDAGIAWHWWVPALALVSGCYLLVVTFLPRRPLTAAFLAVATYFTPLLQWFYTPSSVLPVAWALLALAAVAWIIRDPRLWVRITWSALVGYLAVTMAMGLYVPFMLPGLYVVVAVVLGMLLERKPWVQIGVRGFLSRLAPLGIAAVAAAAITLAWVVERAAAFEGIQSTVYPGQDRSYATGSLLLGDPHLTGVAGAPWSQALRFGGETILGGNSSEASSVILLCVFLFPGLIWYFASSLRKGARRDWLVASAIAVMLFFAAYLFVPGWDSVAKALQIGRVSPERLRIVFVVLLPVVAAIIVSRVDRVERAASRYRWVPGVLSGVFTAAIMVALDHEIRTNDPEVLLHAPTAKVIVPLLVMAAVFFFSRRLVPVAAAIVMVVSMLLTVNVNPIYRGIYDLSATDVGEEVMAIDAASDGEWVGIGSYENMALLVETGVGSYTGVQPFPPEEMWDQIDPDEEYEQAWNRLAHVHWAFGTGDPVVTSPTPDVVLVTFDPCASFAQEHVDYVLTTETPISLACLDQITVTKQGAQNFAIYDVVPPA